MFLSDILDTNCSIGRSALVVEKNSHLQYRTSIRGLHITTNTFFGILNVLIG